jgi:hypothetical protein
VKYTRPAVVALALALSGCGGGGSSSPVSPAGAQPTPTGVPTTTPSGWKQTATVSLSWNLSTRPGSVAARKPQYVSPSSASLVTTVLSVNGLTGSNIPSWVAPNPTTLTLTTTGPNPPCAVSVGVETCAATIPAPPGSVTYSFVIADGSSNVLSETPTAGVTFTIAQGQSNTSLSVSLEAVVASVQPTTSGSAIAPLAAGTPSQQTIAVNAYDADANQITNGSAITYEDPFAITDPDPTGQTMLVPSTGSCPGSPAGYSTGSSVTFSGDSGSGNSLILCYSGQATNPFGLTARHTVPSAPFPLAPNSQTSVTTSVNDVGTPGTSTCNAGAGCQASDVDFGAQTLFFDATGSANSQAFDATELGWTNSPYNQNFILTLDTNSADAGEGYCGTGGSAVVSVSPTSPATSWVVTPQNDGICKATLFESLPAAYGGVFPAHSGTSTSTVYFSMSSTSFIINGIRRRTP